MDEEVRKRLEYEEQFFGMSSRFFADSFKNFVKDELDSKITLLVENFRDKIIHQSKNPEKFKLGIENMKQSLTEEYHKSLEEFFPEIESKISDVLHIPENVLLEEDLMVKDAVGKDLDEIKEEIENLKGTFQALLYLKQEMMEELEEVDSAIFLMEYIINQKKIDFEVLPVEDIIELSKENSALVNSNS